jgi:hypothetical protein
MEKELGGSGGNVWTLFQYNIPMLASWLDWFPGVDPMKTSYLMHEGCVNIEDSDCSRLRVVLWADKRNKSQGSVVTLTTSRKKGRKEGRKEGSKEGRLGRGEKGRKDDIRANELHRDMWAGSTRGVEGLSHNPTCTHSYAVQIIP